LEYKSTRSGPNPQTLWHAHSFSVHLSLCVFKPVFLTGYNALGMPTDPPALLMEATCVSQAEICWILSRYLFTHNALLSQCTYKSQPDQDGCREDSRERLEKELVTTHIRLIKALGFALRDTNGGSPVAFRGCPCPNSPCLGEKEKVETAVTTQMVEEASLLQLRS
jgi:hypothetical protein